MYTDVWFIYVSTCTYPHSKRVVGSWWLSAGAGYRRLSGVYQPWNDRLGDNFDPWTAQGWRGGSGRPCFSVSFGWWMVNLHQYQAISMVTNVFLKNDWLMIGWSVISYGISSTNLFLSFSSSLLPGFSSQCWDFPKGDSYVSFFSFPVHDPVFVGRRSFSKLKNHYQRTPSTILRCCISTGTSMTN